MSQESKKVTETAEPGPTLDVLSPSVRHVERDRRRHARHPIPLNLIVDGESHHAAEWSLGGLSVKGLVGMPEVNRNFSARVSLPFKQFNFDFEVTCRVLKRNVEADTAHCLFVNLDARQVELLRYIADAYLTGKVATVDGALTAVAKTGGVTPAEAAERPTIAPPAAIAPRRYLWAGATIAASLAALAIIARTFYFAFFTVSTSIAWVDFTPTPLRAEQQGTVVGWSSEAGGSLAAGAPLVTLNDPELAAQIDIARSELGRASRDLEMMTGFAEKNDEFFSQYKDMAGIEIARKAAAEKAAAETLAAAKSKLDRVATLKAEGLATNPQMEEAKTAHAAALSAYKAARADIEIADKNAKVADLGYYYTGSRVEGGSEPTLAIEVARAEEAVKVAASNLNALLSRQARLTLVSPCDCYLREIHTTPGTLVLPGDTLATLTDTRNSTGIVAFIPRKSLRQPMIGNRVELTFADGVIDRKAKIVDVQQVMTARNLAFLSNLQHEPAEFAEIRIAPSRTLAPGSEGGAVDARIFYSSPL